MNRRRFGAILSPALVSPGVLYAAEPEARAARAVGKIPDDPRLSRFNPLGRILVFDDFDEGINGWAELVANHSGDLSTLRAVMKDMRPPQLSNCTFFDTGTHGSMSGTYALKLATRAHPNHTAAAIKRLTYAKRSAAQFEMYFTFKAEQTFGAPDAAWDGNASPSERNFGEFTLSNDVCEGETGPRYHCALRYVNADAQGNLVQKWMYKTSVHTTTKMDRQGQTRQSEDYHVRDVDDWKEVPGGQQALCFNETSTKINWHYLRWRFDLRTRRNTELQVNEKVMDLRGIPVPFYDHGYRALDHLLNVLVDVRTRRAVRNFIYIDSALISVGW